MLTPTFEVKSAKYSKTIFMSFGLLNEILILIDNPDNLPQLGIKHDMRHSVLVSLLSDRDATGKITREFNSFDNDLDPETISALLAWMSSHVINFFVTLTGAVMNLAIQGNQSLQEKNPLSSGSQA